MKSFTDFINENYDRNNQVDKTIGDSLHKLYLGVNASPSLSNIKKKIADLESWFNTHGQEKSQYIYDELKKLEPEINKLYDVNDVQYLPKDEQGLKSAPNSQIKRVLGALESYGKVKQTAQHDDNKSTTGAPVYSDSTITKSDKVQATNTTETPKAQTTTSTTNVQINQEYVKKLAALKKNVNAAIKDYEEINNKIAQKEKPVAQKTTQTIPPTKTN